MQYPGPQGGWDRVCVRVVLTPRAREMMIDEGSIVNMDADPGLIQSP